MKKITSLLLSVIILVSSITTISFSALASSGYCGENVMFSFDDNPAQLNIYGIGEMRDYSYENSDSSYNNPSTWYDEGGTVTIKNIIVSDGVTKIGDYAFYQCKVLTDISLGKDIISIGANAFKSCQMIPSVTLPINVRNIGERAFYGCMSMTSIILGNSISSIGAYAFYGCSALTDVFYEGTEDEWNNIAIGKNNENLTNATIHYNFHQFDEGAIIIPATCTTTGEKLCTCQRCGKTETIVISELGHLEIKDVAESPTCINEGKTEGSHCSVCGEILVPQQTLSAVGHTYSMRITQATLSANGMVTSTCSTCGLSFAGETIYRPETVVLSSNAYTYDGLVKTPTVIVKDSQDETISPENYTVTYSSGRKNVGKYSVTIKFKGNYSGSKTLYFTINPRGTHISALSSNAFGFTVKWHVLERDDFYGLEEVEDTQDIIYPDNFCVTGYEVQYSKNRNYSDAQTVVIDNYTTSENRVEGLSCDTDYYVRIRTYTNVADVKYYSSWSSMKSVTTKAGAYQQTIIKEATCTTEGLAKYECPCGCGKEYTDTIPRLDHSFTNYVSDHNANCVLDGTKTALCDYGCGVTDTVAESDTALGHIEVVDKGFPATCIEEGLSDGKHCSRCGEVLTKQETIGTIGHDWTSWNIVNQPTQCCDGKSIRICNLCNEIDTLVIPALGTHSYKTVVTKPTCTKSGFTTYVCSACGDTYVSDYVKATGHKYKNVVTKATTKANGKITPTCSCGATDKTTVIYYPKTVALSKTSYVYDGKAKKPSVTVKDSNGKTISSSNYTVSYSNNTKAGQATVKITFKGNYSGTIRKTFTITPKATTISSVSAASKAFTVKWKKQSTETTGYEIQYSTDKNFKKNNKTVTVSKNSTTSKKVTGLKAKTKYYVHIRTYKTVKVNGKSTKIYSNWSKATVVTTKK